MIDSETEDRLAALEQSQERMTAEIARLEALVHSRRNPGIGFVVRVAAGLVVLWLALQLVPAVVLFLGSAVYDYGGRAGVWSVALVVVLALVAAVTLRARSRRPR
ncbi:hypothetical protein ACIBKZ_06185 [Streptomyces sp. NPDC050421]|uniref:hypothetical protein n=1 Tax=unclassified Streptomyces TaxID=2593676 RepID=UPI003798D503